jgi:hypothetical protein
MARTAAAIQLQIDALEAFLASGDSLYTRVGSNGSTIDQLNVLDATKLLNELYQQKDLLADSCVSRFRPTSVTGLGS